MRLGKHKDALNSTYYTRCSQLQFYCISSTATVLLHYPRAFKTALDIQSVEIVTGNITDTEAI